MGLGVMGFRGFMGFGVGSAASQGSGWATFMGVCVVFLGGFTEFIGLSGLSGPSGTYEAYGLSGIRGYENGEHPSSTLQRTLVKLLEPYNIGRWGGCRAPWATYLPLHLGCSRVC